MMTIHGEIAAGMNIPQGARYAEGGKAESIVAAATARTRGHAARAEAIANALENLVERLMGSEPGNPTTEPERGEPYCEIARLEDAQWHIDRALNRLQSIAERLSRL